MQFSDVMPITLTFSAGSAASMDNAATATGYIDATLVSGYQIELTVKFKYGDGPTAPVTSAVYRSVDEGTTYETVATYSFSGTAVNSQSTVQSWRIHAHDKLKIIITNGTGQAITAVSAQWRAVRS